MIIVSQDKCTIVNLDNIKTIELERETDFKSIIIFRETNEVETGVCGLLIGHYTTKERAKEVLQEIYKNYADFELIRCINDNFQQQLIVGNKNKYFDIYEMPED